MCSHRSVLSLSVSILTGLLVLACASEKRADTSSGATTGAGSVATPAIAGQSGGAPMSASAGTGGSAGARTQTERPAANGGAGAAANVAGMGGAGSPAAEGGAPATAGAGGAGDVAPQAGTSGSAATEPTGMDIFIAPTGADANPGTEDMPLASLGAAVQKASAGVTIWVAPGSYEMTDTVALSLRGSRDKPIRIWARSTDARPVFDFKAQPRGDSKARGLSITGDYWHLRGLDVINAGDNCIHVSGAHNTLEWLVTHDCSDTGIQISANSAEADDMSRAANNLVVNCDSYSNYDAQNQGENADGFAAKLYIGPGNVFRGCRAWNNADDGWDLFASDDVVVIEDSWAIANGKIGEAQNNTNGDGNGFKLGGAAQAGDANMGGAPHEVNRCYSIANRACGFVRNNNTQAPRLSMCGGQGDGKGLLCSLDNSGTATVTMSASDAIMAKRDQDGRLPPIR